MPDHFDETKWVLILDKSTPETESISNQQVSACQTLSVKPKVIYCNDDPTKGPCTVVPRIPAWCNPEIGSCLLGVHETANDFDSMFDNLKKNTQQ